MRVADVRQEGKYEDALQKFAQAMHVGGYREDLAYSAALCQYMVKDYVPIIRSLGDLIGKGTRDHPG